MNKASKRTTLRHWTCKIIIIMNTFIIIAKLCSVSIISCFFSNCSPVVSNKIVIFMIGIPFSIQKLNFNVNVRKQHLHLRSCLVLNENYSNVIIFNGKGMTNSMKRIV